MILELGDGRELKLPDDMPDETARQLKALILALEQRTKAAESEVRLLRDEMAQVRKMCDGMHMEMMDDTATVAALDRLGQQMRRLEQVMAADRMVVPDPITGDMTRSRVIL